MKLFRADLHIHTLLSPCGELSMSPVNIINMAIRKKLDIIGISDHNTTRQSSLVRMLAEKKGLFVLRGAEITTREEVHCLAFFEDNDTILRFQELLDEHLPNIPNNPLLFGDQIAVDENENIIYTEKKLLTNAVNLSLEELEAWVHGNEGIFIPAHIDRMKNSLFSQLGFLQKI
jgi:PHP family Zn ribbon phosphoesterase